jgi:adenosylhomocysteine nucleosidase
MRVLVTFAVDQEFAPWRRLRSFRSIDYDGLRLWHTKVGNAEVTALLTGMGGESSAQAMGLMMNMADQDRYFDLCISSGLAGALQQSLAPGDIIAPQVIIAESRHADVQTDELRVDAALRSQALEQGAKAADCLLTVDRVMVKASQKRSCSSRAQSVDMESFEIIKEASAWGARSVVVRAISDSAREDLPINFNLTLSKKKDVSVGKVILQLLKNPLALPALIRFAVQSRKAAEGLANFLDAYVQRVTSLVQENNKTGVGAR